MVNEIGLEANTYSIRALLFLYNSLIGNAVD